MASTLKPVIQAFSAGAAISKGMAVKKGADEEHVVKGAANTDKVIGVCQNAPTTAEDLAEIAMPGGGGKGLISESVAAGDHLVSHTDGTLVKVNASGDKVIAFALESGASGDLIDISVSPSQGVAAE
jgi:hypothetical protein